MRVQSMTLALLAAALLAGPALGQASRPATPTTAPATTRPSTGDGDPNPGAYGFDPTRSDKKSLDLADATMAAMGGRKAWHDTRYLSWNFFGSRRLYWDKTAGLVRIEGTERDGRPFIALIDIRKVTGRYWLDGEEVTNEKMLEGLVNRARRMWINDSYWLVMPYKLKDTGVIMRYLGTKTTVDGKEADVITLMFDGVGVSPDNKYQVYIGRDSKLVEQWDFYLTAHTLEPQFTLPWRGWKQHGAIMLSGDRGERQLTDIAVHDSLPESVFTSPDPVELK